MTTKIPAFPTASDIGRELENIAPTGKRNRELHAALAEAAELLEPPTDALRALIDRAHQTGEIPPAEELVAAARQNLTTHRDREYPAVQIEGARRMIQHTPSAPSREQDDATLAYLGETALPALVAALDALPASVPLTAEAALNHDDGRDLYRTIKGLVSAYDAIRTAQRRSCARIAQSATSPAPVRDMLAASGVGKDASEWEHSWLRHRRATWERYGKGIKEYHERGKDNGAHDYFANIPEDEWPANQLSETWPEGCDSLEARARWLLRASHELELWVPTWDELIAEHRANLARVNIEQWIAPTTRKSLAIDSFGRQQVTEVTRVAGVVTGSKTSIKR